MRKGGKCSGGLSLCCHVFIPMMLFESEHCTLVRLGVWSEFDWSEILVDGCSIKCPHPNFCRPRNLLGAFFFPISNRLYIYSKKLGSLFLNQVLLFSQKAELVARHRSFLAQNILRNCSVQAFEVLDRNAVSVWRVYKGVAVFQEDAIEAATCIFIHFKPPILLWRKPVLDLHGQGYRQPCIQYPSELARSCGSHMY
ncbi:hypothetical protein C4K06_4685 [Pseudomonas chlororaphis subsp. aureofaciens]|nr:hypothetical protein C4K06_4685 [Pseudomonas chlororaphis subsp. aureofaciens]